MSDTVSVGANASSSNLLAGLLEEFTRRPTRIRIAAVAAATGMRASLILNSKLAMDDQFISLANRFPIVPDDVCIEHVIPAGVRAAVRLRNTTAGAIVNYWAADTRAIR
ncbi:MAG TPA: hypothetical protein VFP15_06465 [Gemmatimonadaceae bacterium]|nr:hypothetical protein [Gemmatimonadaceae bacterium]